MKDLKKKLVMQELSKEEATSVYGGAKMTVSLVVMENGRIAMVITKK